MQYYLVPLNKITLDQCYKLYNQGYELEFNYGMVSYIRFYKRG